MTSYTMHPTEETCWLHRGSPLYQVEFSDARGWLWCRECGGPTHPPSAMNAKARATMAAYERQIDRRLFWRRLLERLTRRR